MQLTTKLRVLLVLSGLLAMTIGSSLLFVPAQFHATNGIQLDANPSLLSEVRAPGGALLVFGAMMLAGAFVRSFALASTAIGATVYLAYGGARLLSMAFDGLPGAGIVAATAIELVMGAICALALARASRRATAAFGAAARVATA